jgi:hypothetical protein
MIITYFGKQFFKIQQGDMVLAFNPVSKSSKTDISAHFGADIALQTTNHPDYNGIEHTAKSLTRYEMALIMYRTYLQLR